MFQGWTFHWISIMFKIYWKYKRTANIKPYRWFPGEDTLWNISFRLFYETQINVFFITFYLISWNWYETCKKEASANYRRGYTMKYFFQSISWNTHSTIVSLWKLPRNVHDILFEFCHEIWKFWKLIFRIFSIVKDFAIEFVFMLD